MRIPLYQVDAFATEVFTGNPAAVCPLESWLPDETLLAIAAENNLSETAFFVPKESPGSYDLRWFTPAAEVDLCGHATLASSHIILTRLAAVPTLRFSTKSGILQVTRDGGRYAMDFPTQPPEVCPPNSDLVAALGGKPLEVMRSKRDYLVEYKTAEEIKNIEPDMAALARLDRDGVIVTAPGDKFGCDFVSRFFGPKLGVPEDPVTGSAHCTLVPFWAPRLKKKELTAKQISKRGGEVFCSDRGERIGIAGFAVLYLEGAIQL